MFNFDEYNEFKNSIQVKFFDESLEDLLTDNHVFSYLANVLSAADIYPISECWENLGNDHLIFRFYSVRKNKIYIVHDNMLPVLKTGKKIVINAFNPTYEDYTDIIKANLMSVNPLMRYEIREIDAWGNEIDGYEYNQTFFMGYIDIKSDIKDINSAFKRHLKSKFNISFVPHKTMIVFNSDFTYEIIAKSTLEPLYIFIPTND